MNVAREVAALAVVLGVLAAPAGADLVEEIPGLEGLPVDARSAGLAGAGIAASEESASLILNPAAVALVRRNETTIGFMYQGRDVRSGLFDGESASSVNTGLLSSAGLVVPVQVVRGAFAAGIVFHRRSIFDRDLVRAGDHPDGGREDEVLEERGSANRWTAGAALQMSPRTFLGISATLVTGGLRRFSEFTYVTPGGTTTAFEGRDDTDLTGISASIGTMYFPLHALRFGLRVDLPHTVKFEGSHTEPGGFRASVEDRVRYPIAVGLGGAGLVGSLMATAEVEVVPYTLMELNGERLRTEDRVEGYRDVAIFRLGLEYTLPAPVRLRAGYRFDPSPYRLLLAEVRDQNPGVAVMETAMFTSERHVVTGGIGILMEGAFKIDVAAEWIHGEKAGQNVLEENDIARVHVTTSYRF